MLNNDLKINPVEILIDLNTNAAILVEMEKIGTFSMCSNSNAFIDNEKYLTYQNV